MLEVEVKVKINHAVVEEKLKELGYQKGTSVYEKDTYFNGKHIDLKEVDKALRIREHKDLTSGQVKYVLNFKGAKLDDSTMTREETQFEIPTYSHGETLFHGLGFWEAGNVEKTRIHYKKDTITCCLDQVTDLGEFLEIEIMAQNDEEYDSAIIKIKELLMELELTMKDTIRHSYLSMLGRY